MNHRILLYRAGALGDTLLTLPALDALRRRYPAGEIVLAANPAYAAPLKDAGRVDGVIDAGGVPFHLLHQPPEPGERDDLDQLLSTFSAGIFYAKDPEGAIARRLARLSRSWHQFPPFPPPGLDIHVADWMRQGLASLGISTEGDFIPPPLRVSQASQKKGVRLLREHLHRVSQNTSSNPEICGNYPRLLGIHPGSGGRAKRPPAQALCQIAEKYCQKFSAAAVMVRGPADKEACESFLEHWGQALPVIETDRLEVLAGEFKWLKVFLGGDSGVTHLAALCGTPSLALFGPFSSPPQWCPIGESAKWISWESAGEGSKHLEKWIEDGNLLI